jgi:hypothetical protein
VSGLFSAGSLASAADISRTDRFGRPGSFTKKKEGVSMAYRQLQLENMLEIDMLDGSVRQVLFASRNATAGALAPGRHIIDRLAIERGLLPSDSTFVSHAKTRGKAAAADRAVPARLLGFSPPKRGICHERISLAVDADARRSSPADATRYDRLVGALSAPEMSRDHLQDALLVDAIKGDLEVSDETAIRVTCSFHAATAKGLYVFGRSPRFHCFSCGADGGEVDWLTAKYGMSRDQATAIVAS